MHAYMYVYMYMYVCMHATLRLQGAVKRSQKLEWRDGKALPLRGTRKPCDEGITIGLEWGCVNF